MTDCNRVVAEETYATAQGFAASGKYADAIEAYSDALVRDPNHLQARCGRALALQQIGEHSKAIADFDEVISRYRDWAGAFIAYYGRAASRQALGQNVEAIQDCDEAIGRKADLIDALYLRGAARKAIGQIDAAISDMNAVLRVDPTYHEAYFVRGKLYCLQQRWEQAIADLTAAVEYGTAKTENARACFYLRGVAAQEHGEHRAAIADFTRVIELIPGDAAAHMRRWRSYREMGERALADADFQVGMRILQGKEYLP